MTLALGQSATITRAFLAADIADYIALGGAAPPEGEAPELLIGALFSYLLGVSLPGRGTNYLKQETRYLRAPRIGEQITARIEIARLRPDKKLVDLSTTCHGADGALIAEGRALVLAADVPGAF